MTEGGVGPKGGIRRKDLEARAKAFGLAVPLWQWDSIDSTQRLARSIRAEATHGTTILAAHQSSGRGRRGAEFVSPVGGLYFSMVLDAPSRTKSAWRTGFAAALAVRAMVRKMRGPNLVFDWPNDLLSGDRKVAGILMDLVKAGTEDRLILGVGVNLGAHPAPCDPALAKIAAGLGFGTSPALIDEAILLFAEEFAALWPLLRSESGWRMILEQVRCAARLDNERRISVACPDGSVIHGIASDIAENGAILIRDEAGVLHTVRFGQNNTRAPEM